MINATAIIALTERVRLYGGAAEVCALHPTDHVYRLNRVPAIAGVSLQPRSYAAPGSLWVTSAAELAKADNRIAWRA